MHCVCVCVCVTRITHCRMQLYNILRCHTHLISHAVETAEEIDDCLNPTLYIWTCPRRPSRGNHLPKTSSTFPIVWHPVGLISPFLRHHRGTRLPARRTGELKRKAAPLNKAQFKKDARQKLHTTARQSTSKQKHSSPHHHSEYSREGLAAPSKKASHGKAGKGKGQVRHDGGGYGNISDRASCTPSVTG